jgi:uncharacterized membrane protein
MVVLALGIALWSAGHFLPSVAPTLREDLIDRVGPKAYRAIFSLSMAIALILIIWGYRGADWVYAYDPPAWGVHANNTLMLIAVYLFGVGGAKGWLATKLRHPMLLGVCLWAIAHLLANGDQASVLLFGGMLLWAVGMIFMIYRRVGVWAPPQWAGAMAEARLILIVLAVFAVIVFTHGWVLGVSPFPG